MSFAKMTQPATPRRLWSLVGFPGSGKSTFAARMRGPLLAIDADHRFDEVLSLAGDVYQLSASPADNVQTERIVDCLHANMAGSPVRTIVVDSLTAIMAPLVTQAIIDNDAGRNKNRMSAFKEKALAMRLLQDAVSAWGCDVLWIYHLQNGRDANANEVTTATISRTELARLTRSINLHLRIFETGDKRAVKVEWARRGRSGMTLIDESGTWEGMPEKIEQAVYGGLSLADQDRIEQAMPTAFAGPEQAMAWSLDFGAFDNLPHARNAYDKLKREQKPKTAGEFWPLWIADCVARKASLMAAADGNGQSPTTQASTPAQTTPENGLDDFDSLPGHDRSVYGKPSFDDLQDTTRPAWHTATEARAWAMDMSAFDHAKDVEDAYAKAKIEYIASTPEPTTTGMFDTWYGLVVKRLTDLHAELDFMAAGDDKPLF